MGAIKEMQSETNDKKRIGRGGSTSYFRRTNKIVIGRYSNKN